MSKIKRKEKINKPMLILAQLSNCKYLKKAKLQNN